MVAVLKGGKKKERKETEGGKHIALPFWITNSSNRCLVKIFAIRICEVMEDLLHMLKINEDASY